MRRDLVNAVSEYLSQFEAEKVPKGWYTLVQLGEKLGVHERQAGNYANRFIRCGKAQRKTFRIKAGSMIRPVAHYKFDRDASKALGL